MRTIRILMLLSLLLAACGNNTQSTASPFPTHTARPTYTLYPTYTLQPTNTSASLPPRQGWQKAQVLQVYDGDTIEIAMSDRTHKLRYIGVDAPELGEVCYTEAARFNSYLVTNLDRTVYLEKDTSEADVYGRLLRYVWIIAPDKYIMVNAELVAMGYAVAKAYPPDTKYQSVLTLMEQQARESGLTVCRPTLTPTLTTTPAPSPTSERPTATVTPKSVPPTPTMLAGCPQGCAIPPPGCVIKGNISSSTGERIYHVPGQRYYEQTKIEPEKGERWFCTEEEAIANGWRKSKV